jgi:signal transduction histidine kinase/HD-like signal output (HDOD) protein
LAASSPAAREHLERILAEMDRLPTLPTVATRLISATTATDSSARQVAEIIETDASLSAAILRLVRRADLGVRNADLSVRKAVTLLGFKAVRNAALTVQLHSLWTADEREPGSTAVRRELWRHNLAVACVAELIAERAGRQDSAGEAFVCGLLHDIGKIALDACLPKSYARVVERVERRHECICDVERELLGLDHTTAGKRLVTRWALPRPIIECVWLHHQPSDSLPTQVQSDRFLRIIQLADNLVRRHRIGFSGYQHVTGIAELSTFFGLSDADLDAVMIALPQRLQALSELIGLDGDQSTTDLIASLTRANRELGRLNEQLVETNRTLERRSAHLSVLAHFSQSVHTHASLVEVTVAAAEALRTATGAPRVLVYCGEPGAANLYTSFATPDHAGPLTRLVERASLSGLEAASPEPPPFAAAPAPASPFAERLWAWCADGRSDDPLWSLDLGWNEHFVAGAVLEAPAATIGRWTNDGDEWRPLSDAIGMAFVAAKARLQLERMTEDLLDANRRLRLVQAELVRGRSLSMIAAMAAGAAHELNNPLSVISGRAQMELGRSVDPDMARTLQVIVEQTRRATQIVSDLMRFAKPDPPNPVTQSLRDVLDRVSQHWRSEASPGPQQLTIALGDPSSTVYADSLQLQTMLDAVLRNAIEATPPQTACIQINSPSHASDDTVRIVVEDNGVGMTREVLEHACDPFFSSRPAGRGRGLGLSHAHRFAEINGGRLTLESAPGAGTRVTIELPARPPGA